jgi:hypothetical protein
MLNRLNALLLSDQSKSSPVNTILTCLLATLLLFPFCKYATGSSQPNRTPPPVFATVKSNQNMPLTPLPVASDYAGEWKTIDSLEQQGLYKSALEHTEALAIRAKNDHNDGQVIKTLIYRGKYATMLEEDGFIQAVHQFEAETATARQPEKAVLQSMLGELYATYLQNQQWSIRNRTPIPGGEGGDILTWSAAQIEQHALDLYSASVKDQNALRAVPIDYIRDITTAGAHDTVIAPLRPTLFDFLGHRALAYFSNERSFLTQPAYKFELTDDKAFAPVADFVKESFPTQDSASGKWRAVRLFQQILAAHLNPAKGSEGGLIDADLLRLQFAHNNSVAAGKDDLYEQALLSLHKQYYDHPSDAEIVWNLANYHRSLTLPATGERNNLRQAVSECEDAIRRHPNTYGAKWCAQTLREIRATSLMVNSEQTNLPDKPALVQINYKNLQKIWVKVVKTPMDQEWWNSIEWDKHIAALNAIKPQQSRTWEVLNPGDFYDHETEFKLDKMGVGAYTVLASDNPDFNPAKENVSFSRFIVSNLAVVPITEKGLPHYVVTHRETGAPLSGVKADFYQNIYNSNRGRNERKHMGSAVSDVNGVVSRTFGEHENGEVTYSQGNDTLPGGNYYNYRYYGGRSHRGVQFFTDRSLYRPGQLVYFKAVLFSRDDKSKPAILPGEPVVVHFYDANHQLKSTLKLKTNEYGTVNGSFTAPASGLTGQMTISAEGFEGGAYFNVEEYKRPKFDVTVKPVEGAYRVNDMVSVKGVAKAYAGSNIDGAQVKYRVVRQARFPFYDYYWSYRAIPWSTESMEITNGTTTSGADGTFEVKFKAIPDLKIPKKDQPVFDYTVTVDVTDINGETRSGEQTVAAGYVALQVNLALGATVNLDSLKHIGLSTTNMSGQPEKAEGEISLQRLTEPSTFYKKRYWGKPDVWTITESEFKRDFPDFAWKEADNPSQWTKQPGAQQVAFNSANAKTIDLSGGKPSAGYYEIILKTKDAFGEPVEIKRIVRFWDPARPVTIFDEPSFSATKTTLEPGETASVWLGGKPDNLHFYFAFERNEQLQNAKWINVRGAEQVTLPIGESDRGGVFAFWFVVRNNRIYQANPIAFSVPWSNKDLNIQYETFRDKLAPGQQEEWRIRISGPKKEKAAAEMVAAMYDASLDQFLPHVWSRIGYPSRYTQIRVDNGIHFGIASGEIRNLVTGEGHDIPARQYRSLNWFNFPMYGGGRPGGRVMAMSRVRSEPGIDGVADEITVGQSAPAPKPEAMADKKVQFVPPVVKKDEEIATEGPAPPPPPANKPAAPSIRTNLNETVFFFPELHTDEDGNVVVKFKMNEALTRWKFLTYAHTKDLQEVVSVREVVTQKDLMVLANAPRFLRAGDEFEFSAKVSNLTKEALDGTAKLALLDAVTLQPVDQAFGLSKNTVSFSTQPGQSAPLRWTIHIPTDYTGAVTWQITADSKQFRDGEESTIPVVTNRMLVTETMPIALRGGQTKRYTFDNLKDQHSKTLVTQRYTLEFTSNPAWYVVQSLPYLMEYPHECSEQIFSRFYANTLASSVTKKMPNIRKVYDRWKGTEAMKSNLSKNQDLKYALLEETPWVLEAQSEEQQRQNIALLFDLNRMADEQDRALNTLAERQTAAGGWPWFPGGRDDWYITQYIVEGMGHLKHLGSFEPETDKHSQTMVKKALGYCDRKVEDEYHELEKLVKQGKAKWEDDHLSSMVIHYLYARSFFQPEKTTEIQQYYLGQAKKYWLGKGLYQEGMLALVLKRFDQKGGSTQAAGNIVNSLRERALNKEELGMYWPFDWGFYWYQMPIETQALMVEVFDEVAADPKSVENLRIWLLKNKQTNRWGTTKATAEAAYALLLHGENWLANTQTVSVEVGGNTLKPTEVEPGTGYFKQQWSGAEVKPSWSQIKVSNPNTNIVWGAAYWQYFEDLDKINSFKKTPLTIVKTLYKEENSAKGPILTPITEQNVLKVGDKIKVRIEIRVDRQMEYVHLKDMRAAGFEPVNVLSGYRWQGGLGYYESTKDLATNFFIDYLPRGTFVFEYPLVVSNRGNMSNGITTLQCMYAPEFTSHSEGIRVKSE